MNFVVVAKTPKETKANPQGPYAWFDWSSRREDSTLKPRGGAHYTSNGKVLTHAEVEDEIIALMRAKGIVNGSEKRAEMLRKIPQLIAVEEARIKELEDKVLELEEPVKVEEPA